VCVDSLESVHRIGTIARRTKERTRHDIVSAGGFNRAGGREQCDRGSPQDRVSGAVLGAPVRVRNVHRPAARFEDYIEHIYRLTRARGITGANDIRVPIYLSMLMLEYPETLAPGRTRERIGIKALACLGRMLRLRTTV
jgi:hypothetical protein